MIAKQNAYNKAIARHAEKLAEWMSDSMSDSAKMVRALSDHGAMQSDLFPLPGLMPQRSFELQGTVRIVN